jgi:hypothetical protein
MEKITKDEAILLGLKRFFTGVPCIHGHLADQSISNGRRLI